MKTGIYSVDVILEMNSLMMLITLLARAVAIYVVLMLLPNTWGDWTKALAIAGIIQVYMVSSVLFYRRKHREE
jgi:hypothetical protein